MRNIKTDQKLSLILASLELSSDISRDIDFAKFFPCEFERKEDVWPICRILSRSGLAEFTYAPGYDTPLSFTVIAGAYSPNRRFQSFYAKETLTNTVELLKRTKNKGNQTMTIKATIKETQETPFHCAVCKATAEDADVDAPCEECSTLLCTLCDCPYCSEAPMTIEIDSGTFEVESIEDVSDSEALITMTTGEEFRVFETLDDAENSVEEYWREMATHDRGEFICIMGANRLLQWALGESDDFGISSLEEFIQRNREACEETLATYDGCEQYFIGFSSTLDNQTSLDLTHARAYRVN